MRASLMNVSAQRIQAERDQAYQRLQLAYQDMQVAEEVINKYSGFTPHRQADSSNGVETIYRRAQIAWHAATHEFSQATKDYMAAMELLKSLGVS